MSSTRERRILKELNDIQQDKDNSGVLATPVDPSNLTHLKGTFPGPPDTPYAGGTYTVDIQIPDMYPFKSPIMKFDTKMWHPNISSQTGAICLDVLGSGWSPVGTIKTALLSLRMLLEAPNPKDPQDAEVAKMMMDDHEYFESVAHDWAVKYASAPRKQPPPDQIQRKAVQKKDDDIHRYQGWNKNLVDRFVNMGFDLDAVVEAFTYVGIDRNGGEDYEMEEAYMGDITARLLGEQ
ncbi:Ubiquitin-conjugating enzyme E2 1 [Cytospora mali]|uniref:Ubiquitin-conjugating enzyme E2 1 n=2 Tax=Cytospora mali TaxID=578113 RepID=A0ACD6AY68_CYTMA|nr:Ubiquitin-conjugating enzyme E2 1 [Valsa mali var. pyri (nom. inval.)]KUI63828.1 Ubiquitin-conjugating enzyme E2 1 [Valsa mali]